MMTTLRLALFLTLTLGGWLSLQAQHRYTVSAPLAGPNNQGQAIEAYLMESVDVIPEFPGGDAALIRFINNERRYPADAYSQRIQGRVLCSFIIDDDGTIYNIEVVKGVDESLNKEAVRIISQMPRWKAGRIGNTSVPVYNILAIPFRL